MPPDVTETATPDLDVILHVGSTGTVPHPDSTPCHCQAKKISHKHVAHTDGSISLYQKTSDTVLCRRSVNLEGLVRDKTMGNLIWRGWAMTEEDIRKAASPTSIIMGKNLVRNAPSASKPSDKPAIASDECDLDNIDSIQDDADVLEDASGTRHFEISFPLSPSQAISERDSRDQ